MDQRSAVAWVIVIVWAALYTRKIADPEFAVPGEVTPVILAAATYLFGRDIRDRIIGKKEEEDPPA